MYEATSPFRSSAGPAVATKSTSSSLAMICASEVLPRPGRAGQQDVVERLAATARRLYEDPELLLDGALADEIVEPLGPKRPVELLLGGQDGRLMEPLHPRCADPLAHRAARSAAAISSSGASPSASSSSSSTS